jgi:pimeloyl-ACP methyl ester carboxylesterase
MKDERLAIKDEMWEKPALDAWHQYSLWGAKAMTETFVLIHGAWHGAWCWAGVRTPLEAAGHRAYALDLPSHGESRFERSKVTLQVYADSVIKFIAEHDLRNVVLAGHSMGGLVISQVAQRIPKRMKRVIFLTAMVMEDGERPVDLSLEPNRPLAELANSRPDRSIPIDALEERFRAAYIQDASKDLQDYVLSALTPQPLAPLSEPVPMKDFYRLRLPTSYLICEEDISMMPQFMWHPHFSGRLRSPSTRSIKCGHESMFTAPKQTAQALIELAKS